MCLLKHEACSGTGPKLVRHHCVHLILPKWVITPDALELKTLWSDFCLGGRADFGGVPAPKSSNGHPRSTIFAREKTSFVVEDFWLRRLRHIPEIEAVRPCRRQSAIISSNCFGGNG